MEKIEARHEKLTDEEIKIEIEKILYCIHKIVHIPISRENLDEHARQVEESIFKLRRHFSPEKTSIIQVTSRELSELMRQRDEI